MRSRKMTRPFPRLLPLAMMISLLSVAQEGIAQIRTDGSLGPAAQTLAGPNYVIPQSLGRLAGNNLFQSFQKFNVGTGQSATFTTTTPGIANVISRVTGGSLSQINGTLNLLPVSGAPNFFFINPAGVTFGAGATINVPGAFHVGAADYVKFPDGKFHADINQASTFSSSAPEAFGYLGSTRGTVTIGPGASIATGVGQVIGITAGDIVIDGGGISSPATEVRIFANGIAIQEVPFSGPLPAGFGNLTMSNGAFISSPSTGGSNGGSISVAAGNIRLDGASNISSDALAGTTGDSGSMTVTASGALTIVNGSFISASTESSGNAGAISINAGSLSIDGQSNPTGTGIYSSSNPGASGNAGAINVVVTNDASLVNGGSINSNTFTSGNAGAINVNAGSLLIAGQSAQGGAGDTGILSTAESGSTGHAGTINISVANAITITNGGNISSDTNASGNAGAVTVNAGSIAIDGQSLQGAADATGIYSDSNPGASGNAGTVNVTVRGTLSIINGGIIESNANDSGDAGAVTVRAGSATIDGQFLQGNNSFTGILSRADGGTGNAGTVDIKVVNNLSIVNGGSVESSTATAGNAGTVTLTAGTLVIDGQSVQGNSGATGIFSTADPGSSGNAGKVTVAVEKSLTVINGGSISSDTFALGNAGQVDVSAMRIFLDGQSVQGNGFSTGFSSDAAPGSQGDAGSVRVSSTGPMTIVNGGAVTTNTFSTGNAGQINVSAGTLDINSQGASLPTGIFSRAQPGSGGNSGSIALNTAGRFSLSNGAGVSSSTYATGNAGSVTVDAGSLLIDAAFIASNTNSGATGNAGSVVASAADSVSVTNGGSISSNTYSSGTAGSVSVTASAVTVDGAGSTINAAAAVGSSGQTGSVSVTANNSILLSNAGSLSISNEATVANPSLIVPSVLSVTAPSITLRNAQITAASTGNVAASDIKITFGKLLYLDPSSIATSAALGNGGSIVILGTGVIDLVSSQITTSVSGLTGNGGNISITAPVLVMNTGFIQANTAAANASGGLVDINVQALIPSGNTLFVGGQTPFVFQPDVFGFNVIQAAAPTGVSGAIQITSPTLDISGSLRGLGGQVLDTGGLGRALCQSTGGSSLAQSGRGGLPPSSAGPIRANPNMSPVAAGQISAPNRENIALAQLTSPCR